MSAEFLITSIIIILLPGTGVLYTLAIGLAGGFRPSAVAAFGCTLGIVPHMFASIVGLAALLHASATAFQVVKLLGIAYLLYMAWSLWRSGGGLAPTATPPRRSARRIVMSGILLNVLNPKLSLFFLAFLPQFIAPASVNPLSELLVLALVFMALTFIVFLGYGAAASLARDYVIARPAVMRWLSRSFAAMFALMGLRLALAER